MAAKKVVKLSFKGRAETLEAEIAVKSEILSASKLCQQAERLEIASAEDYESAAGLLRSLKTRIKEVGGEEKKITGPLTGVIKHVRELFRRPLEMLEAARVLADRKMGEYRAEAKRQQDAAQRKLDAEAAEEQARLRKLADRKATRLEAKGQLAEAAELRASPPTVVVEEAPSADIPKIAGTWTRTVWKCRVVDLDLLVMARAAGKVPKEAVIANEPFLNAMAGEQRGTMRWPGVEVYSEEVTVTGRA